MAAGVGIGVSTAAEELRRSVVASLDEIAALVASPRHRFATLRKDEVPETAGLYVIYCDEPFEVLFVGIARTHKKRPPWDVSDGLRFRIMENHLAHRGNDTFVNYVANAFGLVSRPDVRDFVQQYCSAQWMEVPDLRKLARLEHLAIAALEPRFNRR